MTAFKPHLSLEEPPPGTSCLKFFTYERGLSMLIAILSEIGRHVSIGI